MLLKRLSKILSIIDINEYRDVMIAGDTLFIAGCGRFFEGTPAQMYSALIEKLGSLPDSTVSLISSSWNEVNVSLSMNLLMFTTNCYTESFHLS